MPSSISERVESAGLAAIALCMAGAVHDVSGIPGQGGLAALLSAVVAACLLLAVDLWRDGPWLRRLAGLPPPDPDHNRPTGTKRLP